MRSPSIIHAPVVSEKSFRLAAAGQYTFAVEPRATAPDVAHAIEQLYQVNVVAVRTARVAGKRTRYRGHGGQRSSWKRAIVGLKAGQRIAGFEAAQEKPSVTPEAGQGLPDAAATVRSTGRTAAKPKAEKEQA